MTTLINRRGALPIVCLAALALVGASGVRADSRYRFMVFPFEGDVVRRVGRDAEGRTDDRPTHEQMFVPLFSAMSRCDTYDPEFPAVLAARLEGALSREDADHKKITKEIALRILHAISWDPANSYDAALWVICSEGAAAADAAGEEDADEDAEPRRVWNLELHLLDRLSRWHTSKVFTTDDDRVYESMARYALDTLREMREEGSLETGDQVSAEGAPSSEGVSAGPAGEGVATGGAGEAPVEPGAAETLPGANDTKAYAALAQSEDLERVGELEEALDALVEVYNGGGLSRSTQYDVACAVARLRIHTGDREGALEDVEVARKCAEPWQLDRVAQLEQLARLSSLNAIDVNVHTGRTIEDLKLWLTANPGDEAARVALAEKYMELQPEPNWQRAYEEFDKVFYAHPWEPRVRLGMVKCLIRIGSPQRAVDYLIEWRAARPETFDDACAELLIEAQRRAAGPEGAYAEVLDYLLSREDSIAFSPDVLQGVAEAIDTELVSKSTRFSSALTETHQLLTEGPAGVQRTREELRDEVTKLEGEFTALGDALYAMAPTAGYETWLTQLQRSSDLFLQAIAETKYALDANSTAACHRAADAQRLAASEGQIGIDSRPSAITAGGTPSTDDDLIGPL